MAIPVGTPMVNAGSLYINGLQIAPASTVRTLTLAAGSARDSTNTDDIVLQSAVTINVGTNGVNGLDTGTFAINSFYHVFVIGSSLGANPEIDIDTQVSTLANGTTILSGTVVSEGSVTQPTWSVNNNYQPAGLISLSATAPQLPKGYDMFRRVGTIKSDATAAPNTEILPFWQENTGNGTNRRMWYDAPISAKGAGAAAAFTAASLAVAVPAAALGGTSSEVTLQVDLLPNAPEDFVAFRPTGSASVAGNVKVSGDVAAVNHFDQVTVVAAIAAGVASVDWITDAASTVAFTVSAYVDKL